MSIDAIALVRIPGWKPEPHLFAIALDDAFLVPTTAPFASEPDVLGLALRHRLGDALDRHDDPRGVFMIPDVASPAGEGYEAVIEEIGEAGVWAPVVASGPVPEQLPSAAPDDFVALAGQLMSAIGSETLGELQRAMMSGDAAAFARAQQRMMEAIATVGDPEEIARSLEAALPAAEELEEIMAERLAGAPELRATEEGGGAGEGDSRPPEGESKKR